MDHAPVADRTAPPSSEPTVDPAPAVGGCPFPHGGAAPAPVVPEPAVDAPGCPFPHGAAAAVSAEPAAAGCPVLHGPTGARRTKADLVVRKVLRIPERPPGVTPATAYSTFQRSMLISATRCTLTYVVFPFLLPFLHFLRGGAPVIGVVIGSVALVCDTFTIRRFFAIDHKWRWYFSTIAFGIMCLLSVLLVQDLSHIVRRLTA